jgi:predicted dehydrogenase
MSQGRLKVGVVGLNMGSGHVQTYRKLPDAELIAICDNDAAWLHHCRTQWETPHAFTDYRELFALPELDAVSIALPTTLHAPATLAALEAGKHVLVEKPMALDADEAESMAAAAARASRTLMISHNQRFTPDALYLQRAIESGLLGDVYAVRTLWRRPMGQLAAPIAHRATGSYRRNWFNEADQGGGVARDLGSHMIDLALWFLGFPEPAEIAGCAYTMAGPQSEAHRDFPCDADDHTVGLVRFGNGASLQIEVSFGQHIDKESIVTEVFGTQGGARREPGQPLRLFGSTCGAYTTVEPRLASGGQSAQAEFVASILEGRPPLVTPEQGIAVMRVIDALLRNPIRRAPVGM